MNWGVSLEGGTPNSLDWKLKPLLVGQLFTNTKVQLRVLCASSIPPHFMCLRIKLEGGSAPKEQLRRYRNLVTSRSLTFLLWGNE